MAKKPINPLRLTLMTALMLASCAGIILAVRALHDQIYSIPVALVGGMLFTLIPASILEWLVHRYIYHRKRLVLSPRSIGYTIRDTMLQSFRRGATLPMARFVVILSRNPTHRASILLVAEHDFQGGALHLLHGNRLRLYLHTSVAPHSQPALPGERRGDLGHHLRPFGSCPRCNPLSRTVQVCRSATLVSLHRSTSFHSPRGHGGKHQLPPSARGLVLRDTPHYVDPSRDCQTRYA